MSTWSKPHRKQRTIYSRPQPPEQTYRCVLATSIPLREDFTRSLFEDTGMLGMPAGSRPYGNTHSLTDVTQGWEHARSNRKKHRSQILVVSESCCALLETTMLWVSIEKHRSNQEIQLRVD